MAYQRGDWERLGREVVARRVDLGLHTQVALADKMGLTPRILGDIEGGKRLSYDKATIARLERALDWPLGTVDAILAGGVPLRPSPPGELEPELVDLIAAVRAVDAPTRWLMLEQVKRITEWARYRRER